MPRGTSGAVRARKVRRLRTATKGYRAAHSKLTRIMIFAVTRAGINSYRDRRLRKRDFRSLWITRITAACRARGLSYSKFMSGLRRLSIGLNRKMLSELAVSDPAAFDKLLAMTANAAKG